ncbi:hypothetical protein D3C80_1726210 [compost metagenome]
MVPAMMMKANASGTPDRLLVMLVNDSTRFFRRLSTRRSETAPSSEISRPITLEYSAMRRLLSNA